MSLSAAWEEHANNWIAWARAPGFDGFWSGTWPVLRELLVPPQGVTVDLGCGEGRCGRELLALGYDVVGVERSPTLARAAITGDPSLVVMHADAAALPLGDGVAALVVASMSLQDVDDLHGVLRETGRVLAPGGTLCAAIVHPFNSAEDVASMGSDAFAVSDPYLTPRRYEVAIEREGQSMTFVSMHWPLSAYVTALSSAGMVITELQEFGDQNIPWLLAFRSKKLSD